MGWDVQQSQSKGHNFVKTPVLLAVKPSSDSEKILKPSSVRLRVAVPRESVKSFISVCFVVTFDNEVEEEEEVEEVLVSVTTSIVFDLGFLALTLSAKVSP